MSQGVCVKSDIELDLKLDGEVFKGVDDCGNQYEYRPIVSIDNSSQLLQGPPKRPFFSIPIRVLARQNQKEYEPPLTDYEESERPKKRGDCVDGLRPCPWVSCRFHNYLDIDEMSGSLKINYRGPVEEMTHSCSLDVADNGPNRLVDVGAVMSLTRERVRQLEEKLLLKVRRRTMFAELKASSKR